MVFPRAARAPATFYAGVAMQYDMQAPAGIILLILIALAAFAGCTGEQTPSLPEQTATPVSPTAPVATTIPVTTTTVSGIAALALQAEDLPPDYILRDRSVMTNPEVSQISRDLGWLQGYYVTYDRVGRIRSDHTRIRQSISIFPKESIGRVYNLEKIAHEGGASMMASPDEIPFPATGDRSVAYRQTNSPEEGQVTYTILFTKNNAFERITMSGTSTDYEAFREIVQTAAARIG